MNTLLKRIILKKRLPQNSLYLYSNISPRGEKKGQEISKSISISEPEYPTNPNKRQTKKNKSFVVMNIQQQQSNIELLIRNKQFEEIALPFNAYVKELKSDKVFKHVCFDESMDSLYDYIENNVMYAIEHYEPSNSFGCCSKFEECSNMMQCIHDNLLYSKGCLYRKNLEIGKVFYGLNRNFDISN